MSIFVFFFFQAEDGIRDLTVTGVQTCALPISNKWICPQVERRHRRESRSGTIARRDRNARGRSGIEPGARERHASDRERRSCAGDSYALAATRGSKSCLIAGIRRKEIRL